MRRLTALLACLFLALGAACGGDDDDSEAGSEAPTETTGASTETTEADDGKPAGITLSASVASYDLAIGAPGRFLVGLFDNENGRVGFGEAEMQFFSFGTQPKEGAPGEAGPVATGTYLPIPGSSHQPPASTGADAAVFLTEPTDKGVYQAEVAFPKPGFWQVVVSVSLEGATYTAKAAFQVGTDHAVAMPGDTAIASENPTASTPGVRPVVIDSRAADGAKLPDPELHDVTLKQALAEKRPVLLVISTPTFCRSQFCGPITDMAADLAKTYGDRATFMHFEVWDDFTTDKLNPWAQEWIKRSGEPWVFLIGADGKISHRWDNVAVRADIEPLLQKLPAIGT